MKKHNNTNNTFLLQDEWELIVHRGWGTLCTLIIILLLNSKGYAQGHLPRPVAYYPLDYGGGTNTELFKEVEFQRVATAKNGTILGTTDRFNQTKGAVYFNSTTIANIILPNLSTYLNSKKGFTISFWTKIDETYTTPSGSLPYSATDSRNQIFFANTNGTATGNCLLGMQRINDRLGINRYLPDTKNKAPWLLWLWDPVAFKSSTSGISTPQGWYHIILNYLNNGCQIMMWKPGETTPSCRRNYFWPQDLSKATNWGLGNILNGTVPIKYLDDVKFFDSPLSEEQSKALHEMENILVPPPSPTSYCEADGSYMQPYTWLSSFVIGNAGKEQSYTYDNYKSYELVTKPIGLARGASGTLTINRAPWANYTPYNQYLKTTVWLDSDHNGVFNDNEWISSTALQTKSTSNLTDKLNFSLPSSTQLGWSRMRVVLEIVPSSTSTSSSCPPYSNAEIKDYYVYVYNDGQNALPDNSVTCIPSVSSTALAELWISDFSFSTPESKIDIITPTAWSYIDYTDKAYYYYERPKLRASDIISFTLKFASNLETNVPFTNIWIDYNRNGSFENTELAYNNQASNLNDLTGKFTVPSTFSVGSTRMRIAIANRITPDKCNLTNQHTEDFEVYLDGGTLCASTGDKTKDWLSRLSVASAVGGSTPQQTVSPASQVGYLLSTNTFNLQKGDLINLSYGVTSNTTDNMGAYNLQVKVWIDYNGDMIFDNDPDSPEIVSFSTKSVQGGFTYYFNNNNFLVPNWILNGPVLMRVSIQPTNKGKDTHDPCGDVGSGQVTDFYVNLVDSPNTAARMVAITETKPILGEYIEIPQIDVFPNPSNGQFTTKISLLRKTPIYLELINIEGKTLGYWEKELEEGTHEISNTELFPKCNCDAQQTGMFLLKVQTHSYQTVKKVLILK